MDNLINTQVGKGFNFEINEGIAIQGSNEKATDLPYNAPLNELGAQDEVRAVTSYKVEQVPVQASLNASNRNLDTVKIGEVTYELPKTLSDLMHMAAALDYAKKQIDKIYSEYPSYLAFLKGEPSDYEKTSGLKIHFNYLFHDQVGNGSLDAETSHFLRENFTNNGQIYSNEAIIDKSFDIICSNSQAIIDSGNGDFDCSMAERCLNLFISNVDQVKHLVHEAINLEMNAGSQKTVLYRAAKLERELNSIHVGSPFIKGHSLSFGESLFSGLILDGKSGGPLAEDYRNSPEHGVIAIVVNDEDSDIFNIPRSNPFERVLGNGEHFHPRSRVLTVSDYNENSGVFGSSNETYRLEASKEEKYFKALSRSYTNGVVLSNNKEINLNLKGYKLKKSLEKELNKEGAKPQKIPEFSASSQKLFKPELPEAIAIPEPQSLQVDNWDPYVGVLYDPKLFADWQKAPGESDDSRLVDNWDDDPRRLLDWTPPHGEFYDSQMDHLPRVLTSEEFHKLSQEGHTFNPSVYRLAHIGNGEWGMVLDEIYLGPNESSYQVPYKTPYFI